MLQKTNEKRKNQNCDENKVYVSRDESERSFNCDNLLARFNLKRYNNLNEKEHEAKKKHIIKRTSFQRIRSVLLKAKK